MSQNSTPKVSVIIPVYNVEKYLCKCLDSIVSQTFTDWECILVDDGSIDASPVICDGYAQCDKRFSVIHKENGGASAARNVGIKCAIGDYIMFVDSDDYIGCSLIQDLYACTDNGHIDFVFGGSMKIGLDGKIKYQRNFSRRTLHRPEFATLFLDNIMQYQKGPISKLFRKILLVEKHHLFIEGAKTGEDMLFVYKYLYLSDNLAISDTDQYFYIENSTSLTHQGVFEYSSEIISYNECLAVGALLRELHVPSSIISKLQLIFIEKLIQSIYIEFKIKEDRISKLKLIDWQIYNEGKVSHSYKESIVKFLLTHKLYHLFDTIIRIKR